MFNTIVAETVVAYYSIFLTLLPNQHLAGHVADHKKRLHFPGSLAAWGGLVTEFWPIIFNRSVVWNFWEML